MKTLLKVIPLLLLVSTLGHTMIFNPLDWSESKIEEERGFSLQHKQRVMDIYGQMLNDKELESITDQHGVIHWEPVDVNDGGVFQFSGQLYPDELWKYYVYDGGLRWTGFYSNPTDYWSDPQLFYTEASPYCSDKAAPTPEPISLLLTGLGAGGLALRKKYVTWKKR